jgi:hypothetical protein
MLESINHLQGELLITTPQNEQTPVQLKISQLVRHTEAVRDESEPNEIKYSDPPNNREACIMYLLVSSTKSF